MVASAETLIYIRVKDRQPECWAPAGGCFPDGSEAMVAVAPAEPI